MSHYFFHLIYDGHSTLDESGCNFSSPYAARSEAGLLIVTMALEAQLKCRPAPRQIAVIESGRQSKTIAIMDAM